MAISDLLIPEIACGKCYGFGEHFKISKLNRRYILVYACGKIWRVDVGEVAAATNQWFGGRGSNPHRWPDKWAWCSLADTQTDGHVKAVILSPSVFFIYRTCVVTWISYEEIKAIARYMPHADLRMLVGRSRVCVSRRLRVGARAGPTHALSCGWLCGPVLQLNQRMSTKVIHELLQNRAKCHAGGPQCSAHLMDVHSSDGIQNVLPNGIWISRGRPWSNCPYLYSAAFEQRRWPQRNPWNEYIFYLQLPS